MKSCQKYIFWYLILASKIFIKLFVHYISFKNVTFQGYRLGKINILCIFIKLRTFHGMIIIFHGHLLISYDISVKELF